jgi:hypothetical protein
MFEVTAGSDTEKFEMYLLFTYLALIKGCLEIVYPLNGSSEERRIMRECLEAKARKMSIPFNYTGYSFTLGRLRGSTV